MWVLLTLASLALIVLVLIDGFETMVQPRRVTHRFRFTRLFYRNTWTVWRAVSRRLPSGKRREAFLSLFGPLSLLGLIATWVLGLIVGFGALHWSLGTVLQREAGRGELSTYLYLSGTTFFTLGYGDVTPHDTLGRALAVVEAGVGFGFMALIIGYMPVLYQAFAQREVSISVLDARAGSPPSAGQVLLRLSQAGRVAAVEPLLAEWERWAAMLLESHLSFPVLSYYRSQHDNQSWLAALTTILDTCAWLLAGVKGADPYQAQLTFAMARHAAVDLALIFKTPPLAPDPDRALGGQVERLRGLLRQTGLALHEGPAADAKLAELRTMYEPFVNALALRFLFALPPLMPEQVVVDNWQKSAWTRRTPGIGGLPVGETVSDHFE
jgi:hypothetical protein